MPTLTVREAIHYSAQLQLPGSMSPAKKLARVDRIIREMGLSAVADSRIGGRVSKGISGGERRRVSICMQLLASPGLLFLDEPTSGLDSAAAYHVMAYVARLAQTAGITVVAAVHQPSSENQLAGTILLTTEPESLWEASHKNSQAEARPTNQATGQGQPNSTQKLAQP
ncbi:hypothetical protein HU200_011918 [Digitaria exilis]|uniref:ABC transporter domain-containing protein n=1 Tax=Digitaria exilis TaxID=1010633 RepID=A0A835FFV7_9POAL|nr:hypothetical protein HU200_011918 [Digitaria exilis]